MRRSDWWPTLVGLAEAQAGLFTTAQAQAVGARRPQLVYLTNQGTIERLQHGVYQVSGSPVDQWTAMRAAWLSLSPARSADERIAGDPQGVVSHRSAARLLGLGDLDADRIEVTVEGRRRTRTPDVLIHRGHLEADDWTVHHGLPVTTPAYTVATLARAGLDGGHLATIARDALLMYDVPLGTIATALDPAARRYDYSSGTAFLEDLLRQAGAPRSAVGIAVVAATDLLVKTVADSAHMNDFVRRLSLTPAWPHAAPDALTTHLSEARPTLTGEQVASLVVEDLSTAQAGDA